MEWGRRWEWGSGWGTYVHPWLIHVSVWQNQYGIVKQNKLKIKIKKKEIQRKKKEKQTSVHKTFTKEKEEKKKERKSKK